MSIPRKYQSQIVANCARIDSSTAIRDEHKPILRAAVWAMADEFADLTFRAIPTADSPGLLTFFCDCVRHHWARLTQGNDLTECSYTAHAIHCPFSEAQIIALVMLYEQLGTPIWRPVTSNTLDLKETA